METMNIALPEELKDFVQTEAAHGGYSSVSEYVRALIREDQKRKAEARLEVLLLEGLKSGPAQAMTQKKWVELRQHARRRWMAKQKSKRK